VIDGLAEPGAQPVQRLGGGGQGGAGYWPGNRGKNGRVGVAVTVWVTVLVLVSVLGAVTVAVSVLGTVLVTVAVAVGVAVSVSVTVCWGCGGVRLGDGLLGLGDHRGATATAATRGIVVARGCRGGRGVGSE